MKQPGPAFKEVFYPESKFGGFSKVDGTIAFYLRIQSLLRPDSVVVDFGCGRGAYAEDPVPLRRDLRIFKGKAARVIGLDRDEEAAGNLYMDEFHLLKRDQWPLPDGSADLVVCDNVLEHLEQPVIFFQEARRVLANGGVVCIRTPNLWGYVASFSRLVPNRSHTRILVQVKERTRAQDVFPTYYRCNTIPKIRRMLGDCGFDHVVYGFGPEPSYLSFSKIAYLFGVLHQRLAPGFLQPVLFAFGQIKKEAVDR